MMMTPSASSGRTFFYCREAANRLADEQLAAVARAGFRIDAPENLILEDVAGSSAIGRRRQFCRLLNQLREGDRLVVGGLDALGRNAAEILHVIRRLAETGVQLYCASLGSFELTAEDGRQFRETLAELAAIERELSFERSRAARGRGAPVTARSRSLSPEQRADIAARLVAGASVAQLAREYKLPRQAIIRIFSARVSSDERLLTVPASEATRHTIEAVAMIAGDEARRR